MKPRGGGEGEVDWVNANAGLVPPEFFCPITGGVLEDPVVAEDGVTYSRTAIEAALRREQVSPATGQRMGGALEPNVEIAGALAAFRDEHGREPPPPAVGEQQEDDAGTEGVASLRDLREVFGRLDRLRDVLATTLEGWQPPQLVVMGGESSGKSTLLARLAMMPLFPAHHALCTRLPIHVRLRHCSALRQPRLEVRDADTGALLEGPWEVPMGTGQRSILAKMEELVWHEENQRRGVHTGRILVVHVDSPGVPSLDLVDLPGLVQSPADMAAATEGLVRRYVRAHGAHSIFLVAVPAAHKPNDSKALAMVHELGVQGRTIGVLTMADELPKRRHGQLRERLAGPPPGCTEEELREWLNEPLAGDAVRLRNGYVATAIEPLALGEAGRSGQTLGSCYEVLQAQAAAEGAFFEEAGLQDLAAEGRATCNELVRRVNSLFRAYIAGTWAPVTVFKLNQERQQLRFLSASLGLPEAAEGMRAEELQEVRKLAVAASEGALAQGLPAVLQAFGGMLSALRAQLAGLVPAEQTILPEDMEERWFGLADRVMAVCARACEEQESFWEREVRALLTRRQEQPPWPSAEGIRIMEEEPMFQLYRFPHFIEAVMQRLRFALKGEQRESVAAAVETFLGRFFDELLPQPCVALRPLLSRSPAAVQVQCNNEALADTISLVFLRHGLGLLRGVLIPSLGEIAEGVPPADWQESCAGERDALRRRFRDVEAATTAVRRLSPLAPFVECDADGEGTGEAAAQAPPPGTSEAELCARDLLRASTARCVAIGCGTGQCSAVVVGAAIRGQSQSIRVEARDGGGRLLTGGALPFRVSVYGPTQEEADEPLSSATLKYVGGGAYEAEVELPEDILPPGDSDPPGSITVELYGSPVAGSPFSVTLTRVSPPDCYCEAGGGGLRSAEPGAPAAFEVVSCGRGGAKLAAPRGLPFAVSVAPAEGGGRGRQAPSFRYDSAVEPVGDGGRFSARYTIHEEERVEEVDVSVTLYGGHISGSPFRVPVRLRPLHMVSGIVHGFPKSHLSEWHLCYDEPYDHPTMKSNFPTSGEWLLVCAALEGSDAITLGAFGERSVVTQDHTGSDNVAHLHNGAYWYWRPHRSVGFAPKQRIHLSGADTMDEGAEDRLSWHLEQAGNGGWRVGDIKGLEKEPGAWRKQVYVWPSPQHPGR